MEIPGDPKGSGITVKKSLSSGTWMKRLEFLEEWGYITAGLSFLFLGMITFVDGWITFFVNINKGIVHGALELTNNLLFVVILLELFRTLFNFLKSRVVTIEPFLVVAIIAGVRSLLTAGAQLAQMEVMDNETFYRYLYDVGANVVIIFMLVLAFFLYKRSVPAPKA